MNLCQKMFVWFLCFLVYLGWNALCILAMAKDGQHWCRGVALAHTIPAAIIAIMYLCWLGDRFYNWLSKHCPYK